MNKKIPSDYNRFIMLEGVGEVSRPVDIDQSVTGFSQLVSLRIYKFLEGQVINGEAEEDEVCIVFLRGDVTMEVTGKENYSWTFQGRKNVFDGLPYVVYLPPHYHYKLSPHSDAEVAYARTKAEGRFPPRLIRPEDIKTESVGEGLNEHQVSHILQKGEAEKLLCKEILVSGGHWQPYPPQNEGLEQLTYYRMKNPNGFALARFFDDRFDEAMTLKDSDSLAIDKGNYTVAVPPNCTLYGLWFLVGLEPTSISES
jgi:5-deoxy-glucuronate isomerase